MIHIGDYSVCVNAATMALIDAGIPMKDYVCACSASYIEDTPILGKLNCDSSLQLLPTLSTQPTTST